MSSSPAPAEPWTDRSPQAQPRSRTRLPRLDDVDVCLEGPAAGFRIDPVDAFDGGQIERSEMTGHFTFPFRPELPPGHPGFGMPLPDDPVKRKERIDWIVTWADENRDGTWTRDEFLAHVKSGGGKPSLSAVEPGGSGEVSSTHVKWELNRGIPEIPSPIFRPDDAISTTTSPDNDLISRVVCSRSSSRNTHPRALVNSTLVREIKSMSSSRLTVELKAFPIS